MSDFSKKSGEMPSRSARERIYESAACADSFMTSPSEPVSVNPFWPSIRVLSMNRMSPPLGVHATPVATPGSCVRSASSEKEPYFTARVKRLTDTVSRSKELDALQAHLVSQFSKFVSLVPYLPDELQVMAMQ